MRPEDEFKDLTRQIEELTRQRKKLEPAVQNEQLKGDTTLFQNCMDVKDQYDSGDWNRLSNTCSSIVRRVSSKYNVSIDVDPVELIKSQLEKSKTLLFPVEFGLKTPIHSGNIVLIRAKPGKGKSSFIFNMICDNLINNQTSVLFSLEMTCMEAWLKCFIIFMMKKHNRPMSFDAVKHQLIQLPNGELTELFWKFVERYKRNVKIVEAQRFTADRVCATADHLSSTHRCQWDYVYIDYIQKIWSDDNANQDMRSKLMQATSILKDYAKDNGLVMVMLSQANKDLGSKESEGPHEEAAISMLIDRPVDSNGKHREKIKFIVDKNRYDGLETVLTGFHNKTQAIIPLPDNTGEI